MAPDRPAYTRWTWLDLRLAPTAVAVWVGTLLAPLLPARSLFVMAVSSGGVAVVVGVRHREAAGARHVVLAVCAALAVTAGTAAVRASARESSPLSAAAAAGRSVSVTLTLEADPSVLAGAGAQVMGPATVTELDDGTTTTSLDAPVLLFAPSNSWHAFRAGQTLRVRARPSPPRAGDDVLAVLSIRGPPTFAGGPGPIQRGAGAIRDGLAAASARMLDPRPAGLLPGLVVGDTRAFDPLLAADFKRAGLSHLTAVSGANVAIVVLGILWPLRRRTVRRRIQAVVAGTALAGFVVLATPTASVLRAAVMGAITLLALATGRQRSAVPALATSIIVLVLADPGMARDAGFALSVVATASIVVLAPGWSRRLREHGWPRFLADAVSVSGAAGLATAPIVAALSGTVSLVSLPANLLAAPAVAPATVLGLVAALIGPVLPWLGDVAVWVAGWPARWLVVVAERCAAVPDAATGWPAGSAGALGMTFLLLVGGWGLWRFPRWRVLALAAVVGATVLGWPLRQTIRGWPPAQTVLVACDVGQGDALVLPTGRGQAILVDSGREVTSVDRCLDQLGVDSLPLVLLSHLDADHAGGLAGALTGRSIGVVATGTLPPSDTRVVGLDHLLGRFHRVRTTLVPGNHRQVGSAAVDVLAPDPGWATASATPNDMCLVVRVTSGGLRLLLTGDLSAQAEARILETGTDVRADVLKVPHHGSADTDPDFLAATGARVALISVGAHNTYGHPTQRALTWLAQDAMWVHRTDREGDLAVAGSPQSWGVADHPGAGP